MAGMDTATASTRGYEASKKQLLSRLARIEGQVRGIARMVEEDRYCIDDITQVSAIHAALDKVSLALLDSHARVCMAPQHVAGDVNGGQVDELMGAVGRLLGR